MLLRHAGCRPTRPARRPGTTTCSPPSCTRWATRSGSGTATAAADRDDLMYGWLYTGERRLPGAGEADGAVAGSITTEEFLGAPIDIGVLPAGKTVTIQWQATIDPQTNQLIVNPVNTGTVSATNGCRLPRPEHQHRHHHARHADPRRHDLERQRRRRRHCRQRHQRRHRAGHRRRRAVAVRRRQRRQRAPTRRLTPAGHRRH